ncbi:MAG: hypothetical protein JSS87_14370 [Acidobacteria bacterium]|nr:hypothetical protein [Acidobacteriota bacterium]
MKFAAGTFWGAVAVLASTLTAGAQFYKIHGLEAGVNATGRYVTPIGNENARTPQPTEGVGFLLNLREQPFSWAGIELNYGYNQFNERYDTPNGVGSQRINVPTVQHEATIGYVAHVKTMWGVQPFLVVGGGATDFVPRQPAPNQWRGAGMYEVGFDVIPKWTPRVGFRFQQHALIYKAPDFYQDSLRSNTWVHQSSPAAGVFMRF